MRTRTKAKTELENLENGGKILSKEERLVKGHLEEMAGRNKKFWKDGYDPDPTKALLGAGKISHPELWKKIISDLEKKV